MIERVLDQAVQKKIVVVSAPRHSLPQPGVVKGLDGFANLPIDREQLVLRLPPRFRGCGRNRRKVLFGRPTLRHWIALYRAQASAIPHADMRDKLPNGVRAFDRMSSGMLRVDTCEQVT